MTANPPATAELCITLAGSEPPIWRQVAVPADIGLHDLHAAIQIAMDWQEADLHWFAAGGTEYVQARFVELGPGILDERQHTLADLIDAAGGSFRYGYACGVDGAWLHDIDIVAVRPEPCPRPRCLGGAGKAPPEDCGSIDVFQDILAARRAGTADPLDLEMIDAWLGDDGDPAACDHAAIDAELAAGWEDGTFDWPELDETWDDEDDDLPPPEEPFVHAQAPVGRNDPCPCGSGKKHKKCCGA